MQTDPRSKLRKGGFLGHITTDHVCFSEILCSCGEEKEEEGAENERRREKNDRDVVFFFFFENCFTFFSTDL